MSENNRKESEGKPDRSLRKIAEDVAVAVTEVIKRPDGDTSEWKEWVIGCIEDELRGIVLGLNREGQPAEAAPAEPRCTYTEWDCTQPGCGETHSTHTNCPVHGAATPALEGQREGQPFNSEEWDRGFRAGIEAAARIMPRMEDRQAVHAFTREPQQKERKALLWLRENIGPNLDYERAKAIIEEAIR